MAGNSLWRRLRGALGNMLVWGLGFATVSAVAVTVVGVLSAIGVLPGRFPWREAMGLIARLAIIGGVAGAAFSTFVGLLYRGRRLSEISSARFGVSGALVTGLVVPLFLQAMSLLSGNGLVPMELVLDDALMAAVIGGLAAGGTLKIAQLADKALPEGQEDQADRLGAVDGLALGGVDGLALEDEAR